METNNFNVHGVYCLGNSGGLEIEVDPFGDYVRYRMNYGDSIGEPETAEIMYGDNPETGEVESYFMWGEREIYFSEIFGV